MKELIIIFQLLAGASDGIREQVLYHPDALFVQCPKLNRQWWDSRISWENKYNAAWYVPVAVTDANHFFKSVTTYSDIASICVSLGDLNWKTVLKKLLISVVARKAGFFLTYNLYFKNK